MEVKYTLNSKPELKNCDIRIKIKLKIVFFFLHSMKFIQFHHRKCVTFFHTEDGSKEPHKAATQLGWLFSVFFSSVLDLSNA